MTYKEMDPEDILRLIADETDVIAAARKNERLLYEGATCPECGHVGAEKKTDAPKIGPDQELIKSPFSAERILANGYAKCPNCGAEFLPMSNITLSLSNQDQL